METRYTIINGELYHYGVPGMKWGVRKDKYKAMNRQQRKQTREKYYKTPEGKKYKTFRNIAIGTFLGGPVVGIVSGVVTAKRNGYYEIAQKGAKEKIDNGKKYVEKLATTRTNTLIVATPDSLPSGFGEHTRVTGQEEAEFWKAYARTLQTDR